jgi:aromatic-L-amino-acid decarboxylase
VPLGRRFRALKLWFVIRHYGVQGLQAHIREHIRLAAIFEEHVRRDERFEILSPRTMNLVCFRLKPAPGEALVETNVRNKMLMDRLNASGHLYLTHTALPIGGKSCIVLRMAIGSTLTQERHVAAAWRDIADSAVQTA